MLLDICLRNHDIFSILRCYVIYMGEMGTIRISAFKIGSVGNLLCCLHHCFVESGLLSADRKHKSYEEMQKIRANLKTALHCKGPVDFSSAIGIFKAFFFSAFFLFCKNVSFGFFYSSLPKALTHAYGSNRFSSVCHAMNLCCSSPFKHSHSFSSLGRCSIL